MTLMADCVFCDYEPKERVLATSKSFYAMPALGQISNGGHVIIAPKAHYTCLGEMSEKELDELDRFMHKLKAKMRMLYGPLASFEQGVYGQTINHAHLQIVPVPADIELLPLLQRSFPNKRQLHDITELITVHRQFGPYMFYHPQNMLMHAFLPVTPLPDQYLRKLVSQALGKQKRGDWRQWRASKTAAALDDIFIEKTVEDLSELLKD